MTRRQQRLIRVYELKQAQLTGAPVDDGLASAGKDTEDPAWKKARLKAQREEEERLKREAAELEKRVQGRKIAIALYGPRAQKMWTYR